MKIKAANCFELLLGALSYRSIRHKGHKEWVPDNFFVFCSDSLVIW